MASPFKKTMAEVDRELEDRMRDAFEPIEPDEDACNRMLSALKSASPAAEPAEAIDVADVLGDTSENRPVRSHLRVSDERENSMIFGGEPAREFDMSAPEPRRRVAIWKIATPIAACLVVAAIGFAVANNGNLTKGDSDSSAVTASIGTEQAQQEGMAYESAAPDGEMAANAATDVDEMSLENPEGVFTIVVLEDGTELTIASDEVADKDLVGEQLAETDAFEENRSSAVPCIVYEYGGVTDYAVAYANGDGTIYVAHPIQ